MDGAGKDGSWYEKKYGWLATINSITKDRKDWDYYIEMPAISFLNYLSQLKDEAKYIEQKMEEEKRKSKNQTRQWNPQK